MNMGIIFILFIVLLIVGTNIYVNLGICSLLYCLTNGFTPLTVVQRITMAANSFPLLAAPPRFGAACSPRAGRRVRPRCGG